MEEIQRTGAQLIEAAQTHHTVHKVLENYLNNTAYHINDFLADQMYENLQKAEEALLRATQAFYKAADIEPFGQYIVTRIIKGE
jgi:flagellar motor component MotA